MHLLGSRQISSLQWDAIITFHNDAAACMRVEIASCPLPYVGPVQLPAELPMVWSAWSACLAPTRCSGSDILNILLTCKGLHIVPIIMIPASLLVKTFGL